MIKELATYIEDNIGTVSSSYSLTIGTNLFAGFAETSAPSFAVIVEELVPGLADGLLTDKVQQPFRILVRDTAYWTARSYAQALFVLLHGEIQVEFPVIDATIVVSGAADYVLNIECNTPFYTGKDDKGRHVFVLNLGIKSQQV